MASEGERERERWYCLRGRGALQHSGSWTAAAPCLCASADASSSHPQPVPPSASIQNSADKTEKKNKIRAGHGVRHAEQRGSGARQAAQTSVAAAADSHPDQTALQLGHRALPVPQPHPGEAAPRAEEAPHVLALLAETVNFNFPSEVSTCSAG